MTNSRFAQDSNKNYLWPERSIQINLNVKHKGTQWAVIPSPQSMTSLHVQWKWRWYRQWHHMPLYLYYCSPRIIRTQTNNNGKFKVFCQSGKKEKKKQPSKRFAQISFFCHRSDQNERSSDRQIVLLGKVSCQHRHFRNTFKDEFSRNALVQNLSYQTDWKSGGFIWRMKVLMRPDSAKLHLNLRRLAGHTGRMNWAQSETEH